MNEKEMTFPMVYRTSRLKPSKFLILRKEFLMITENNILETLILGILDNWDAVNYGRYIHEHGNGEGYEGYIRINLEDLQIHLQSIFSISSIKKAIKSLKEKDFIIVEKNKENKWDKTNFYFLNIEKINEKIENKFNEYLENSKLITKGYNLSYRRGKIYPIGETKSNLSKGCGSTDEYNKNINNKNIKEKKIKKENKKVYVKTELNTETPDGVPISRFDSLSNQSTSSISENQNSVISQENGLITNNEKNEMDRVNEMDKDLTNQDFSKNQDSVRKININSSVYSEKENNGMDTSILEAPRNSKVSKSKNNKEGFVKNAAAAIADPKLNSKVEWVKKKWNEVAEKRGFPKILNIKNKRLSRLISRLKEIPDKKIWIQLFDALDKSEELYDGKESWFNFDYVIRSEETFERILNRGFKFLLNKNKNDVPDDEEETDEIPLLLNDITMDNIDDDIKENEPEFSRLLNNYWDDFNDSFYVSERMSCYIAQLIRNHLYELQNKYNIPNDIPVDFIMEVLKIYLELLIGEDKLENGDEKENIFEIYPKGRWWNKYFEIAVERFFG